MEHVNFKCSAFSGETCYMERDESDVFAMIVSTRAGGTGINLTAANHVILFESDWNPMCDTQAIDRTHRIGQVKEVFVYRLIAEGTIDEAIITMAGIKSVLSRKVLGDGDSDDGVADHHAEENENRHAKNVPYVPDDSGCDIDKLLVEEQNFVLPGVFVKISTGKPSFRKMVWNMAFKSGSLFLFNGINYYREKKADEDHPSSLIIDRKLREKVRVYYHENKPLEMKSIYKSCAIPENKNQVKESSNVLGDRLTRPQCAKKMRKYVPRSVWYGESRITKPQKDVDFEDDSEYESDDSRFSSSGPTTKTQNRNSRQRAKRQLSVPNYIEKSSSASSDEVDSDISSDNDTDGTNVNNQKRDSHSGVELMYSDDENDEEDDTESDTNDKRTKKVAKPKRRLRSNAKPSASSDEGDPDMPSDSDTNGKRTKKVAKLKRKNSGDSDEDAPVAVKKPRKKKSPIDDVDETVSEE